MPDAPAAPPPALPPAKPPGMLTKVIAILPSLSASAKIAAATFLGLASLTAVAWLIARGNPTWVPWGVYLTPARAAWLLGLAAIACLAEYALFRTWFDESPIRDADLRSEWKRLRRFLIAEQVDLSGRPCYLILDSADRADDWFAAAGLSLTTDVATPDATIRACVSSEATYIVLRRTGTLGRLVPQLDELRRKPVTQPATEPVAVPAATASVDQRQPVTVGGETPLEPDRETADQTADFAAIDVDEVWTALRDVEPDDRSRDAAEVRIESRDVVTDGRRLAAICRRLACSRRPIVPANGVCVLLPSGLFSDIDGSGSRVGTAVRHDLNTVSDAFGASVPTTLALVGAEEDDGIVEAIRRGGPKAARTGELGLVATPSFATADEIERYNTALASQLTQTIAKRFHDPASVGRPYAERIFRTLCRLRGAWGRELRQLVARAFDPATTDRSCPLMSGVAMAATGAGATQQAFARTIAERMAENQAYVEWTARSRRRERLYRIGTWLCSIASVLAIGGLVVQLTL